MGLGDSQGFKSSSVERPSVFLGLVKEYKDCFLIV